VTTTGHASDNPDSVDLDARYGRSSRKTRQDRMIAWIAAAAFVIVFAAWVIWAGLDGSGDSISTRDTGHKIIDDRQTRVSFEVTMDPGLQAQCALQVQNDAHAIVGWKIVDVPVSAKRTQSFTEVVRTSELGVTGLIYRCWPV
jgi:hypothetical protein